MPTEPNYWIRRRLSRRNLIAAGVAGGAALTLAGCGGSNKSNTGTGPAGAAQSKVGTPSGKQAKRGGSVNIRLPGDPPNFSIFTASFASAAVANVSYNKLTKIKAGPSIDPADTLIEPDLAAAMPETPDDTTLIYKLRPGIKFHTVAPANGRELTAEDVKATIDAYRGDSRSAFKPDNAAIDSVEATDATTLRIKLKQPFAPLLGLSSGHYGWRVPPKELLAGDELKTKPVGTGPYVFDSYQPSSKATYKRHADYFKSGLPYLDAVTFSIIPEDTSAISAFQTGQVSVIGYNTAVDCTNAEQIKAQKKDAHFQQLLSSLPGGYMALDTTRPPFSDVRVRRALSMAYNRKAESAALECGGGKPDQLIPTGAFKKSLPIDQLGDAAKYWDFNPNEAKRLLAEAGYAGGFDTPLLYTPQYGKPYQDAAERAIADFAAVGIRAKPQSVQYNEWIASVYRPPFNFQGMLWGPARFYSDVDPYIWYWLNPDPKQGISNQSRVNDPTITPLLEQQRRTLDQQARLQVIGQIQKIVADQQYYLGRTTGNGYHFWESWLENWSARLDYDFPQLEQAFDSRL